jgi:hypothetical protein
MGIISGVFGSAGGIYNTIKGARQARDAQNALENYERQRQELENIASGLSVSTLGSDLLREENARISASNIDALRGAGTRGIIGGSGRVGADNNRMNREIAADLDRQQRQIDEIAARDQAVIRNMQENREIGDINALSSQITAGQNQQQMGMGQFIKGAGAVEGAIASIAGGVGGAGGSGATEFLGGVTDTNRIQPSQNSFIGTQSGGSGMGATSLNAFDLGVPATSSSTMYAPVRRNPRMGGVQYDANGFPIFK